MTPRGKRALRITIIIFTVLVLSGVGVAIYLHTTKPVEIDWDARREDGMTAVVSGNYTRAINMLGGYILAHPTDEEAVLVFVQARRQVPERRGEHIVASIRAIEALINAAPDQELIPAREELMDLYLTGNLLSEAIATANLILEHEPNHYKACRTKALSLARMRRLDEALEWADRALALDRTDLEIHILAITAMDKLQRPAQQLIERAERYRFSYPQDPRFELLTSYAFYLAGDHQEASRWLKTAATRPAPSPDFIRVMLPQLDTLGLYPDALRLLEASVTPEYPTDLRQAYVRRLWQADKNEEIIEHLADLDPTNPDADSDLLAMRVLALYRLKQRAEADTIVDQLAAREDDPIAAAWTAIIKRIIAESTVRPIEAIQTCRIAMSKDPRNPYIRYYLGHAYALIGEADLAIAYWRQAVELAPSWSLPYTRIARALTETGRGHLAITEGEKALQRAPQSLDAIVATALAWSAMVEAGRSEPNEALIGLLERLQGERPRDEATIPAYVSLLAKASRREEAIDAINWAISERDLARESTLLEVADISRQHKLDMQEKIYETIIERYGRTASIALARALDRLADGYPLEGLRLLNAARQRSEDGDTVDWDLALARYQDAMGDSGALATWNEIATKYPDDLRVQRMALISPAAQNDRRFQHETIERVRALTGSDALAWRLARVRWLLNSPNIERDALQAKYILEQIVFLLPNLVEPKILQSQADAATGRYSAAVHMLDLAAGLQIESHQLTLEVADLLWTLGDRSGAVEQISRVTEDRMARPRDLRMAAAMLTELGETDHALAVLLSMYRRMGVKDTPADLQLARLYQQKGMFRDVERIIEQLAEEPTFDSIIFAANFYGARGDLTAARNHLARLARIELERGQLEFAWAEWLRRFETLERSIEYYRAATEVNPANRRYWHHYIANLLRFEKVPDALAAVQDANQALRGDPVTQRFAEYSDLAMDMVKNEMTRDLVVSLVLDPDHLEPAIEAMRVIQTADQRGERLEDYLPDLVRIANRYPRSLAVQDLTVRVATSAQQHETAFTIASRTMEYYPFEERPVQMAAYSLAAQANWTEAIRYAQLWRVLSLQNTIDPDLLLAEAYIHLDTPAGSLSLLTPHLQSETTPPLQRRRAVALYAIALVEAGQIRDAEEMLMPLLADSVWWRTTWIQIATVWIDKPEFATAWLRKVEPYVSERDAFAELLALARGYQLIGEKFDHDGAKARAIELAKRVSDSVDAPLPAMLTMAYIAEKNGDQAEAERQYRRILRVDANHTITQNNLAMILAQRGDQLDFALDLAGRAVAMYPRNPSYKDTYAFVLFQMDRHDDAIQAIEEVVAMDPYNATWQIHRATMLLDAGQQERLYEVLADLEKLHISPKEIPDRLQEQILLYRKGVTDSIELIGSATQN